MAARKRIIVAITGASGALYAKRLLEALVAADAEIFLIVSTIGRRLLHDELGMESGGALDPVTLAGTENHHITVLPYKDVGACIASGSFKCDAMVVIPCSVGTLARIANGIASHLIERAADVCLKEKRPLVLCVRETPLNKIHIRNMYRAADAGATVFPLIPAFYYRPASLNDMAREFAYRVLAHLGLPQPDAFHWKG